MKSIRSSLAFVLLVATLSGAQEEGPWYPSGKEKKPLVGMPREENPQRISIAFSPIGHFPVGDYGEVASPGPGYGFGGYYHLSERFVPTFDFEHAFPRTERDRAGRRRTIQNLGLHLGGRVFLTPPETDLRPWLAVRGGWNRFSTDVRGLPIVLDRGAKTRNDFAIGIGGGADLAIYENFSLGAGARANFSLGTGGGDEDGAEDLTYVTVFAAFTFSY